MDIFGSCTLWYTEPMTVSDILAEEGDIEDIKVRMTPPPSQICQVQGFVMADTGSPHRVMNYVSANGLSAMIYPYIFAFLILFLHRGRRGGGNISNFPGTFMG